MAFWGAATEKPLNRLTQNLAWVITSGTPLSTQMAYRSVQGVTPRRGEMLMVCAFFVCSLAQVGSNRWTDFDK